jgi:RsiW-degrading membrane proteinase PrsW (M82 family)
MILKVFLAGMVLVLPAGLIEQFWHRQLSMSIQTASWATFFWMAFLVVALVEEGLKTGFLIWLMAGNKELNEPVDGIIYGITLGLGFAALENLLWVSVFGYGIALLRGVVTTLAHASFTGWLGFYIAKYRFRGSKNVLILWLGFFVAWVSHGLYDFLLFLRQPVSSFIAFILISVLVFFLYRMIQRQTAASPFRGDSN